ncbi:hypothetical protein M758_11G156600 [Ceratodon purpureus]|nr:hypothetical protein M758_11G156600 [Ceratodon purpureus]
MGFPEPILKKFKVKGIARPSPIQVQGLQGYDRNWVLRFREYIGLCIALT